MRSILTRIICLQSSHIALVLILGYALLKYDNIRFDKVILCASILPRDFPWQDVLDRGQVTAVLNEYGSNDLPCRIAPWFIKGAGTSGQEGFWSRHDSLVQNEFHFTHSEYFERGHIEAHWFPFIEKKFEDTRQLVCLSVHRPRPNIPWALYLGYAMLLLAVGFFIPWPKFGPWSSAPVSQVTPVMGASTETLQTQLRLTTQERDEVREQLGALERNLSELGAFTQRFGVIDLWSATNLFWGGKLLIERLRKNSAALLITAPPETQLFADYLISVIGAEAVILDTEHPEQKSTDPLTVRRPSDTDLDAPKVPLPDFNGVAVHGVGEIQNAVEGLLKRTRRCIIVRTTKKTIEGLAEYYKRDVIWVEVGKEPLWNNSPTCDR